MKGRAPYDVAVVRLRGAKYLCSQQGVAGALHFTFTSTMVCLRPLTE